MHAFEWVLLLSFRRSVLLMQAALKWNQKIINSVFLNPESLMYVSDFDLKNYSSLNLLYHFHIYLKRAPNGHRTSSRMNCQNTFRHTSRVFGKDKKIIEKLPMPSRKRRMPAVSGRHKNCLKLLIFNRRYTFTLLKIK